MRSLGSVTLLIACASGCASPAGNDLGRSDSPVLTSCVTLRFDEIPNGDSTPEIYTDQGVRIRSGQTHLHMDGATLRNHAGCCSTPYFVELVDGAPFSVASVDVVQFLGAASQTFVFDGGTPIVLGAAANGTTFDEFGPEWSNITRFEWRATDTGYIDNLQLCPPGGGTPVYYGADTNTDPANDSLIPGSVRFFAGRLGSGSDLADDGTFTPCSVVHFPSGLDVITNQDEGDACDFDFEMASLIGAETTYGYWLLRGPRDRLRGKLHLNNYADTTKINVNHRLVAYRYGLQQARAFIQQLERYETVVPRITVFADIEPSRGGGHSGWFTCDPGLLGIIPNVCPATNELNQIVLNTFFRELAGAGYVNGVYTNVSSWITFFDTAFRPTTAAGDRIPFVLWTASCGMSCAYFNDPDAAAANRADALDGVLAGSRAVIWQYAIPSTCQGVLPGNQIPNADLNLTEDDPRDELTPVMLDSLPHPTQSCSAGL